jgi:uncharacterized protein (DUF58 family)
VASELGREVLVWPAPVEYRREAEGTTWRAARSQGELNRAGHGGDLMALRRYAPGDSQRLVHWKATARLQKIMVRQFAAEGLEGFTIRVDTDRAVWARPEQFELALSLAATLAEDLFKLERLQAVVIDGEAPQAVRRLRDLEFFLDRLALLEPGETPLRDAADRVLRSAGNSRRVLQLEPLGALGVAAMIDGKIAATA